MLPVSALHPDLFADCRVLVTGGGRGIGAAVAQAFLALGAEVLVHSGRDTARAEAWAHMLPAEQRTRLEIFAADLATEAGAAVVVDTARQRFGTRLSVLVNNAGTMLGRIPATGVDAATYAAVADLNARSVVLVCGGLAEAIEDGGAIVNTTSISARTGGSPGSALYSAAKAFVSSYTRTLAKELAPRGIRVNAVAPGTIATDFHERYSSAEKLEATRKSLPLGRLGTPEDCVGAYLFLAAPALSGYVTGQIVEVNGGQLMP